MNCSEPRSEKTKFSFPKTVIIPEFLLQKESPISNLIADLYILYKSFNRFQDQANYEI